MIPELTQHQRDLMAMGLCPFCEKPVRRFKPVLGAFAPEWFASMREAGLDPSTGHAARCLHKEIRL